MPSADAKSRQSSAGKKASSLFRRKDKSGQDDSFDSGSQSSRYSQKTIHERPSSGGADDIGLKMNAGVITAIPYESVAPGSSPATVDQLPRDDLRPPTRAREPLPHHLNKGGGDFHQYPAIDMPSRSTMGPPRPPPHSSISPSASGASLYNGRASNASTIVGGPYYYQADSSNNSILTKDSDGASLYSQNSDHRNSSVHSLPAHQSYLTEQPGWRPTPSRNTLKKAQHHGMSITSANSLSQSSFAPNDFSLRRPSDAREIEAAFHDLMMKRGWNSLPEQARRQMEAYSINKKWTLVYQDRLAEWQGEQKRKHQSRYGPSDSSILDRAHEEGSPEWYVRKVLDNSIKAEQLQSLSVSLRTQPIGWVKQFVEAQGQIALTNVLHKINRRQAQGPSVPSAEATKEQSKDLEREYDIVKCLKALMNNKYGADNALQHAQIVMALAGSLTSPRLTTRKLVSEVLTFLCHWSDGQGHRRVLQALDNIKNQNSETGRFDAWMRLVEVTIDGRGKMGSLVGASGEVRAGGIGVENMLMEYAVASLLLVNALIDTPERDLQLRCHIRAQFIATGIKRLMTKMESFQYEVIDKQVEQFQTNEAIDYEDLMERENNSIVDSVDGEVKDLNDPVQIVDAIQSKIQNTRAQDYFVSLMQHLLLIRDNESEDRLRMFQLVDAMLSYVAMDRRLPDMDLKQALNFTVQNLLDKLYTDSEARQARDDAVQARQIADAAISERDDMRGQVELGAEGLVRKLKKHVEEQEGVMHVLQRRNEELKAEVAEMQRLRAQELQRYELETRELYLMVRDFQDAAASAAAKTGEKGGAAVDPSQMKGILDRHRLMERLEMQLERAKTRAKLEGKVWQQITPSDKLRELREKMDGDISAVEGDLAQYNEGFLQSVSAARIRRKAVASRPLPAPTEEDEEAGFTKAKLVDVSRPKMNGVLGEITSKIKRYDGSDDESEVADGVTTGTTHPSIDSDSPRTPADDKFDGSGRSPPRKRPDALPGFGTAAPPPPGLDGNHAPPPMPGFSNNAPPPMPGFGSSAPAPPPPPLPGSASNSAPSSAGLPPPAPPLPGAKRGPGFLPRGDEEAPAPSVALGVARPKKKLKALHWEKVDTPQVTIWASHAPTLDDREEKYRELSRKGVLDEVEKLFLAKEIKALGASSSKKEKKKQIISSDLMKTWQISLAKFSQRPVDEIVRMIIHCDREMLENNVVMDFLQKEELCSIPDNTAKLMAPYSKDWTGPNAMATEREQDPTELTREDQLYLYTAFELHHYWKARMRALSLTKTFEPEYDEISAKLKEVVTVSESLRNSVSLLNVLGFVLMVGNFMNDANKQASGFKISSLTRLGMIKDVANQGTFADFVERSVRNKFPEWESFVDEIGGVVQAKKLNVDQLIADSKKYIDNISNVQASLDAGNLSDTSKFHPEDRVAVVVQRSMKEARRKAEQLKLFLDEMQQSYDEILGFFGEDPQDEDARRGFFAKFAEFVAEWKVRLTFLPTNYNCLCTISGVGADEDTRNHERRTPLSKTPAAATKPPWRANTPSSSAPPTAPRSLVPIRRLRLLRLAQWTIFLLSSALRSLRRGIKETGGAEQDSRIAMSCAWRRARRCRIWRAWSKGARTSKRVY